MSEDFGDITVSIGPPQWGLPEGCGDLSKCSDEELRAEVRRRGYDLHSTAFSEASQKLLREIPEIRARLDALEALAKSSR